jgi:hypothetical protein
LLCWLLPKTVKLPSEAGIQSLINEEEYEEMFLLKNVEDAIFLCAYLLNPKFSCLLNSLYHLPVNHG